MTTEVIKTTADGSIVSDHASVYATAREGGGTLTTVTSDPSNSNGQAFPASQYRCIETFLIFDTAALVAKAASITSVVLACYLQGDASTTDFTSEARTDDWGASLTDADWVAGSALSGKTLLASLDTSGIGAGYNDYTSEAALVTAVLTGSVPMVLSSSRHRIGNAPSGNEFIQWESIEGTPTDSEPQLTVVYVPKIASKMFHHRHHNRAG